MQKIKIENIAEEKGRNIAIIIFDKYGEEPTVEHKNILGGFLDGLFDNNYYSRLKVEEEVYKRSLHESTGFFLDNDWAKNNRDVIEALQLILNSRLENPKVVKKLSSEEMLADCIKIYAIDFLLDMGLVL